MPRRGEAVEEASEEALIELAYARNLPLVATNPANFAEPHMHKAHDAMLCIANSTQIDAEDRPRSNPQAFVKSAAMMEEAFADLPEATANTLVIAQRLARRLCSHCKQPELLPEAELLRQGFTPQQLPNIKIFKPVGCDHCTNGYKGRVGIYEVMPITAAIAQKIMQGANSLDIAKQAQQENINNLRQSGLLKAASGLTSLAEVNRVTNG